MLWEDFMLSADCQCSRREQKGCNDFLYFCGEMWLWHVYFTTTGTQRHVIKTHLSECHPRACSRHTQSKNLNWSGNRILVLCHALVLVASVSAKSATFRLADIVKLSRRIYSRLPKLKRRKICQSPWVQPLAFFHYKCFMKLLCHVPVLPYSIFHNILSDASDEFITLQDLFFLSI